MESMSPEDEKKIRIAIALSKIDKVKMLMVVAAIFCIASTTWVIWVIKDALNENDPIMAILEPHPISFIAMAFAAAYSAYVFIMAYRQYKKNQQA